MAEFRMPQLGADMAAATLTEWLAHPGDTVAHGDIVAVVETEKGAIEIEVFEDGVIEKLLVEPGTKVPVGTVLATIGGEMKAPDVEAAAQTEAAPPKAAPVTAIPVIPVSATPAPLGGQRPAATERIRISPAAARLAAESGVDIGVLKGTGPGGAIRLADVEVASGPTPSPLSDSLIIPKDISPATPKAAMRRAIAAAMGRSKREIPHYYLSTSIDMTRALQWLARANERRTVADRLIYSVLLIKAVARALKDFPELNGFWQGDAFEPATGIHVGWTISLRGGGLVAPALHDADQLAFDPLMTALRDLVQRARAFRLRGSELSDPTITVTNLGDQGAESVYGVIYPPQVAIVGFGRIAERPWIVDGAIRPTPVIKASLAADHRVSDGHRGGRFLNAIDQLLQEPERL